MNANMSLEKMTVFFLVSWLLVTDVHAYLDPGTGSFLLQLLIGSALGGLYLCKRFWRQIAAFLTRFRSKDPDV